jgi:hypothetical protein
MLHSRRRGDRQRGQIIVLFELVLIVILGLAALVIDGGVLRNNRQILVNTLDSAALAGGTLLPVDGSITPVGSQATAAKALIAKTIQADYPGLTYGTDYTIFYKCLIGADATGPLISRDVPSTCDPRISLHIGVNSPLTPSDISALATHFTGAGATRVSDCDPTVGDKCNVVQIKGSAITQYKLGPVIGVNNGSTGQVVSAACAGPCGQGTIITPVDLVVIIDRTASMSDADVTATKNAANAILGVYDPSKQRVALGLLGPSSALANCAGTGGPAVNVNAMLTALTPPAIPTANSGSNEQSIANANGATGATTLVISKPTSTTIGDFLIAGITVDGGSSTTVTEPAGWKPILKTDNSTNVGIRSYYKVAVAGEPASYTWTISPSARASGGILRYTGVNPIDPINISSGNTSTTKGTAVTALSVTTDSNQTALVDFFGTDTSTTFTAPTGTTERFDVKNTNAGGPSTQAATSTLATAKAAGNDVATAAASAQWAAQLIALNPLGVDTYGTSTSTDLSKWIPVGLTGTDTDTPNVAYNEAYVGGTPATLNASAHIVSAISCFDSPGGTGTNLSTPITMATYLLKNYGRPNTVWGILLETDGQPDNASNLSPASDYTCYAASNAAALAKGTSNSAGPIQIFTVGFGIASAPNCPDATGTLDAANKTWHGKTVSSLLASMATQPSVDGGCPGTSNGDNDHYFCEPKTSDLTGIFQVIARALQTTKSHLVQLYPAPVVWSVSTSYPSVTISGEYFTGLSKVTFGGVSATITPGFTDGSITATAPCTTCHGGTPIDVVVTTAGGTSSITSLDKYTYP